MDIDFQKYLKYKKKYLELIAGKKPSKVSILTPVAGPAPKSPTPLAGPAPKSPTSTPAPRTPTQTPKSPTQTPKSPTPKSPSILSKVASAAVKSASSVASSASAVASSAVKSASAVASSAATTVSGVINSVTNPVTNFKFKAIFPFKHGDLRANEEGYIHLTYLNDIEVGTFHSVIRNNEIFYSLSDNNTVSIVSKQKVTTPLTNQELSQLIVQFIQNPNETTFTVLLNKLNENNTNNFDAIAIIHEKTLEKIHIKGKTKELTEQIKKNNNSYARKNKMTLLNRIYYISN